MPEGIRPHLREYFRKIGKNEPPYDLFGVLFFISIGLTAILFMVLIYPWVIAKTDNPINQLLLIFILYAILNLFIAGVFALVLYFVVDLIIYGRTQVMEDVLPDYLELVSTNLRGGMSFEQSLWAAITPEFKVLSDEISLTAKKVLTGTDLDVALIEFSNKYDSSILKRTISLIASEIGSGGKIADILDSLINNMKETKKVKSEMTTSVISYMIFIASVVIVIGPGLFALSFNIMELISVFSSKLAVASKAGSFAGLPSFSDVKTDSNGFLMFSLAAITLISICSSMIVSILEKGHIKSGVKYIPVFTAGAIGFYFIFFAILRAVFLSLF